MCIFKNQNEICGSLSLCADKQQTNVPLLVVALTLTVDPNPKVVVDDDDDDDGLLRGGGVVVVPRKKAEEKIGIGGGGGVKAWWANIIVPCD